MKKIIYLFALSLSAIGCSVDSLNSEELTVADAKFQVSETPEYLQYPTEPVCAGDEVDFKFYFNDKPGNITLKLQLEVNGEYVNLFNENFGNGGPESFMYSFEKGVYNLRYFIGGGGHTDFVLTVNNCNPVCAYGKGYWTNHGPVNPGNQANVYPEGGVIIAGTAYDLYELQTILQEKGNIGETRKLMQHLITVILNIYNGVDGSSIENVIAEADAIIAGDLPYSEDVKDALEAFVVDNACEDDSEYTVE